MELDELKDAWQALDRKLDRQYALELQRLRESKLTTARSHFRLLIVGRTLQLLGGVALNLLMFSFLADHFHETHLDVEAGLLSLFGFLMMASAIREFQLIAGIDLAAPVIVIQRKLINLKNWHLMEAYIFALTGCFVWVPLTLVGIQMLFGSDLSVSAPAVVTSFVLSACVCLLIAITVWAWLRRPGRQNFSKHLENHAIGRSIIAARQAVDDLVRFEEEERSPGASEAR